MLYKTARIFPYLIKVFVFVFVVYVAAFTADNVRSIALNTLTFVATILVDAWILKIKIKTKGYSLYLKRSHTMYLLFAVLMFLISILLVMSGWSLFDRYFNTIKNYSFIFLLLVGVLSVGFEIVFSIGEDD